MVYVYTVCYMLMCMSLGTCLNYSGGGDVRAAVAATMAALLLLLLMLCCFYCYCYTELILQWVC